MTRFIDEHWSMYGVEPICRVLPIAPSTYYLHVGRRADPAKQPARQQRGVALLPQVRRASDENQQVYGAKKVWKQLQRERWGVARCAVERSMRQLAISGVVRGKAVRTTMPILRVRVPLDRMNRQFKAERPDQLWVSTPTSRRGRGSPMSPS